MTFFAQELKNIAERCEFVGDARYVGKACVFRLSENVTGKMEFATEGVAQEYSALKITLFNRKEGVIDTQKTTLGDIIGRKTIYGNKKSPYIWSVDFPDWYGYKPTNADYDAMAQTADEYLEMFAEPQMGEDIGMSM